METVNFAPIHDYQRVVRTAGACSFQGGLSSNEQLVRAEAEPGTLFVFVPAAPGTIPTLIRRASR